MTTKNKQIVPFEQDTNAAVPPYCVLLEEVGAEKNSVNTVVREVTGLSPIEAKALVDAVESAPQIIIRQVSASRADEICLALEGLGAQAKAVSESADPGAAKALKLAVRNRAAAEKKAAKKEAQRNVVLELFRDKVLTEFLGIKAYLENELTWFEVMLGDSGVDTEVMPEVGMAVHSDSEEIILSVVIGLSD